MAHSHGSPTEDPPDPSPPDPGPVSEASADVPNIDRRRRNRLLLMVGLRVVLTTTLLLLGYWLLPLSADGEAAGAVVLFGGLAVLVAVIVRQLQRILASPHPIAAGTEAVATILPIFIVLFAYIYVWISTAEPAAFSQPIDRVDGIYFTVTVLSTVGFGDITPVSHEARIVTTLQMLLGLLLIGVVAKLVVGASQAGFARKREGVSPADRVAARSKATQRQVTTDPAAAPGSGRG